VVVAARGVGCGCLLLLLTQLLLLDRIMIAAAAPCNLPNYMRRSCAGQFYLLEVGPPAFHLHAIFN
jgi:hypothetical protein